MSVAKSPEGLQSWLRARARGALRAVRSPTAYLGRFERSRASGWASDDLADVGAPTTTVVIASTARSGSSLLASGLAATGRFGVPDEYFNGTNMTRAAHAAGLPVLTRSGSARMWVRRLLLRRGWEETHRFEPSSVRRYLDSLVSRRTMPNGVFSLKVHWSNWALAQQRLGLDESWFPQPVRWVHISRVDTVAQAVSMVRAEQTGRWSAEAPGRSTSERPLYDAAMLMDAYRRLRDADTSWRRYFAGRGIEPIHVRYEELAADYAGTIRRVAAGLGHPVDSVDPPRLERQADQLNIDWARRFRAEHPHIETDTGTDVGSGAIDLS